MTNQSKPPIEYDTTGTLFRHNLWANKRLFEVCAGLNDEQMEAMIVGTYGSIRDTLRHLANAEYGYWHRLKTGRPYRRPEGVAQTLPDLIELIQASGEGLIEIASKVQANDTVEVDWDGTPRSVPSAIILTQVINHATEHRAQIMVTLTQLGIEPPDLDSWTYFDGLDSA